MEGRRPRRKSVWAFARKCHLDAGGDHEAAQALVRERAKQEYGSIFVSVIVAIAFQLLKIWWNNRTSDPGETPTADFDGLFESSGY